MTTTETVRPKLVDMEILWNVYEAANERLESVRAQERETDGIAKTDLTDVARAALHRWNSRRTHQPGRRPALVTIDPATKIPSEMDADREVFVASCSMCEFQHYGYTRAECRTGSKGHAAVHTRTFRFTMHRETYDQIKQAIQDADMSVAGVVQEGLDAFARTGQY